MATWAFGETTSPFKFPSNVPPAFFCHVATRLEVLLDKIAQNAPDALIVLSQITPLLPH